MNEREEGRRMKSTKKEGKWMSIGKSTLNWYRDV